MKIPLVDLQAQHAAIEGEVRAAVDAVLRSTRFVGGPDVGEFEKEFAAFLGAPRCVAVSNGTAALYLALKALGVGPGDEVVTTPMTFIATVESIRATGADVAFADVLPEDLLLDPAAAERAVTHRTKAIVPVHLYGQCADMDALADLARRRSLLLVEDAAQAHGASWRGRAAGTLGRASAFSFYPGKNLGAIGDGGAVVTGDAAAADAVAMLRDHGRRPSAKYEHEVEGFNHRLSTVQAAVLRVKLKRLRAWVDRRAALAADLDRRFAGSPVARVRQNAGSASAHHLYVVRVRERDRVLAALQAEGIGAGIHYPIPVHLQPAYASFGLGPGSFPAAEAGAREVLSLPLYPEMTEEQVARVADATLRAAGRATP